jgi:type IV pilus assembly protein PilN
MKLTINLATRIYIDMKRLNFFTAGAIVLLTLLLLFNAYKISSGFQEKGRLNHGITVLEGKTRKIKSAAVPEKQYQALLSSIRFANGIIERKTFDWLMLFDRLESIVPDGIAISSIEPSPKDDSLKLAGAAKSFGNLRKFVENLEESQFFTEVYLVSQSEAQGPSGRNATAFNITCKAMYR